MLAKSDNKYTLYMYTLCPKKVSPLNILQQPLQTCTDLNEILHTQDGVSYTHLTLPTILRV